MNEDVQLIFDLTIEKMDAAVQHLDDELAHIRAGKASPRMLDGILVEYYGAMTPITQVASITTPDARTIAVQPWERNMINLIEKAIRNSPLGINPDNNGELIRVILPPLTEERRKEMVKQVNKEGENARVSIRSARKDANDMLKKAAKDGLAEDEEKLALEKVQEFTNQYAKKVEDLLAKKEKEILTV
ncbi:MAG: ribosome recycling factor [Bacteroidota bacterium]|nr:ribosome recycling factor [Bacteroidota bacterium]